MPFQPFNYANIPVNEGRDLVGSLIEGYKAGKLPQQYKRQAEAEELANAIAKMKFEQMPEEQRIAIALKEAQTQKLQVANEKEKMLQQYLQQIGMGGGQLGDSEIAQLYYRKMLGLPEETPTERENREFESFKKKERFKTDEAENLTTRSRTMNQSIVQAIENTLPLIGELKEFSEPNQLIGKYMNPNDQANYEARVATITDALVSALNLPKTNESINLVSKIVTRRPLESHKSYNNRLDELVKDLGRRREKAKSYLRNEQVGEQKEKTQEQKKATHRYNPSTGKIEVLE